VADVRAGRRFFARGPAELARRLLGQRLVRVLENGERLGGLIVETEAYLGAPDRAAHSFGGRRTARVEPMYGEPGTSYVYFTYGMHFCFNVVCGRVGEPVAVLIRALEPMEGVERMRELRGGVADRDLCRGPARLCEALAIDRRLNGVDLAADGRLFIEVARGRPMESRHLANTPRIGVGYAGRWARRRLRWHVRASPHVSGGR
jgi:DNA-3-methyladenine glycosylase